MGLIIGGNNLHNNYPPNKLENIYETCKPKTWVYILVDTNFFLVKILLLRSADFFCDFIIRGNGGREEQKKWKIRITWPNPRPKRKMQTTKYP